MDRAVVLIKQARSTRQKAVVTLPKRKGKAEVWVVPDVYNKSGEKVTDGHAQVGHALAEDCSVTK